MDVNELLLNGEPMVLRAALEWLAQEMTGGTGVCPAPFPTVVTPRSCPYRHKGDTSECPHKEKAAGCWVEAALAEAAYRAALAATQSRARPGGAP